jgi:hypothetical protein
MNWKRLLGESLLVFAFSIGFSLLWKGVNFDSALSGFVIAAAIVGVYLARGYFAREKSPKVAK